LYVVEIQLCVVFCGGVNSVFDSSVFYKLTK